MDYLTLGLCDVQSTSDQIDYKVYPYIAANMFSALIPRTGSSLGISCVSRRRSATGQGMCDHEYDQRAFRPNAFGQASSTCSKAKMLHL